MAKRSPLTRADAMRMAQMADDGMRIKEIAEHFGVSTETVYQHLDTIRPESVKSRRLEMKAKKATLNRPREMAVEEAAKILASGAWTQQCLGELASRWQCSRMAVRDIVVEASVKIHNPINPYYLSAIFVDSIESLRRIGCKAERMGDFPSAINAYKSAGALIAVVTKAADRPLELGEARRDMTSTELIAQGWTPPVPKGLPKPFLQDPDDDPEAK